jgi:predicted metallopeptidase
MRNAMSPNTEHVSTFVDWIHETRVKHIVSVHSAFVIVGIPQVATPVVLFVPVYVIDLFSFPNWVASNAMMQLHWLTHV